jgi:hypothetical protein
MSSLRSSIVSSSIGKFLSRRSRGDRRKASPLSRTVRFRSALESLEGRTMMANVATTLVNGNLTLTDNGSASNITISQPAANQIKLSPAVGTTINGQANAVTINGVTGDLTANLGGGNDTLTFDLSGRKIDVRNLKISGTTGNKTVQTTTAGTDNFLNVHGNYKQTFGNATTFESTHLNQFHVDGDMTINHANGGSFVFLGVDATNLGTQFNTVGGDLTVDNVNSNGTDATGFDVNALEETNVDGDINADMGNASGVGGWTTVGSLSRNSVEIGGDVTIDANNGLLAFGDFVNDGMEVRNALVNGDVMMHLGSGAHSSALYGGGSQDSTTARSVTITGSGAHDTVTIGASQVRGDLRASLTGRGANSIFVDDVLIGDDMALTANGGGNTITIDDQVPGSTFNDHVDINMTGTNNLLSINSKHRTPKTATTTFHGRVRANLGSGDDILLLANIGTVDFDAASTFNGGSGDNFALVGDVTGVDPTIVNFS